MNRRDFIRLAPAAALGGAALWAAPRGLRAAEGATQVVAAQRFKVGAFTVTALSDGFLPLGFDLLAGLTREEYDAAMRAAFFDPDGYRGAVNAFLLQTGRRTAIVDSGTGAIFGPTLGHLSGPLAAAGVTPEAVDTLLVTHLHPDHIGGAFDAAGAVFPNAEFAVSEADRAFWLSEDLKAGAPDEAKPMFDVAGAAVAAYGNRLRPFEGEAEVLPGVTAIPLPGHTVGHVGYRIDSEGEALLIWGDIVHVPPVQFGKPAVTIGFDTDQDLARKTRETILEAVAAERLMVAGAHLVFPGAGHVEKAGEGYRFHPAPWAYF